MSTLDIIRSDPMLAWFSLFAALLIVVPAAVALWRRLSGRGADEKRETPSELPTRRSGFGNQTELLIVVLVLAVLVVLGGIWRLAA